MNISVNIKGLPDTMTLGEIKRMEKVIQEAVSHSEREEQTHKPSVNTMLVSKTSPLFVSSLSAQSLLDSCGGKNE